jgi:hypothetical protein
MIHLNLHDNYINVTVQENLIEPNFRDWDNVYEAYLGIYSQVTKHTKWVFVHNLFTYSPRTDTFYIRVVNDQGSEQLENAVVYLKDKGYYEYSIYTRFENNPEPNSSEQLLERGKLLYGFNDITVTSYNPNIEIITYDRQ